MSKSFANEETLISSVSFKPRSLKEVQKLFTEIDKYTCERLINFAVNYNQGQKIKVNDFNELRSKQTLSEKDLKSIFSAIIVIVNTLIRVYDKQKIDSYRSDLINVIRLSDEFAELFINAIYNEQWSLRKASILSNGANNAHCQSVEWKLDVIVSNNLLSKIMEPIIFIQLTLNNGRKVSFECTLKKFSQLRFAVASSLKEINRLEESNIFKIQ